MAVKNEERDVYYIPPNFLTGGRLFGGSIRMRNAVEAGILALLTGIPLFRLPFPLTTRIILLCLVTLPLAIFGLAGFEGVSLSEFAAHWLRWVTHRRVLYRTDADRTEEHGDSKAQGITIRQASKRHAPPGGLGIRVKSKPGLQDKLASLFRHREGVPTKTTTGRKTPQTAEEFIPISDIRDSIIETTDGRYIKILEVEPINFLLRSPREQKSIIAFFAAWMKISPVKVQIKVLTKKADISYSRNQGSSSRGGGSTGASGSAAGAGVTGGHGVIGVAQRAIGRAAASAATGSGNGMRGHVGNAVFNSSLAKGGALATGVISSVALGSIAENGSITGTRASEALTSYLGYHGATGAQPVESGRVESPVSSVPVSGSDAGPAFSGGSFSGTRTVTEDGAVIHNSSAFDMGSGTDIPSGPAFASSAETAPDAVPVSGSAPTYRNVEIGGGRITEKEHRIRMSVLEINAALAGIDLSGSKLESYTKSICRSRSMLRIIENALELVRMDPDNGEMLYQILYLTYFCDQRLPSRDAILIALSRKGFAMSPPTYHKYLKLGILAMDRILWGYTALDLNKISEELCSKVALTSSPPGS